MSAALHAAIFALAILGLPVLFQPRELADAPIFVDLVEVAEETTPQPLPEPAPPKKEVKTAEVVEPEPPKAPPPPPEPPPPAPPEPEQIKAPPPPPPPPESRRPVEEHMIERLAAPQRGVDEHPKVVADLGLAHELAEALWPEPGLAGVAARHLRRHQAPVAHVLSSLRPRRIRLSIAASVPISRAAADTAPNASTRP